MLAQSFMSAADLGICDDERGALIHVLGMLERGELRDVKEQVECHDGFNMGTQGLGCGTPACIGGWAARLMDKEDEREYVNSYMPDFDNPDGALTDLYWRYPGLPSAAQAATALRSYLTCGDAKWHEAVAEPLSRARTALQAQS